MSLVMPNESGWNVNSWYLVSTGAYSSIKAVRYIAEKNGTMPVFSLKLGTGKNVFQSGTDGVPYKGNGQPIVLYASFTYNDNTYNSNTITISHQCEAISTGSDKTTNDNDLETYAFGWHESPIIAKNSTIAINLIIARPSTEGNILCIDDSTGVLDAFTISYNLMEGSPSIDPQFKAPNKNIQLTTVVPTRENTTAKGYTITFNSNGGNTPSKNTVQQLNITQYNFKNWNINISGESTAYQPGATYTDNANATLYAQWNRTTTQGEVETATVNKNNETTSYIITYDANTNGGNCNTASSQSTATVTYNCKGWYTASNGGVKRANAGGSYLPNQDETLYAQWSKTTGAYSTITLPAATKSNSTSSRKVVFDSNGGTTTILQRTSNATITYSLKGWYTSSSGGTLRGTANQKYTPTQSENLYAQFNSQTGAFSSIILPTEAECTRTGYKLLGFSTSATATTPDNGLTPGASYTPQKAIKLYAVWQANGIIHIYVDNEWKKAIPYIYNDSKWQQTMPYIYNGSNWKLCGE